MKNYIGIDLGTTNSAICSYDGEEIKIWKSPEQNDVTPSAIYVDRRGNKYFGKRAYDSAPHSPDNAATLFKRLMGTSTPINLSGANLTKTPEECSAEILKVLFGYLPEEVRNDSEVATVITVPAAFNQMQKEATMQAAEMAEIGKVALMQEPVAAVMSVMRAQNSDGIFLIYDLGGGTLDIAIAESIRGRVNLLAHGGISMCGGRDFDRLLVDNIVKPWLFENFDLPEDLTAQSNFKPLLRLATWATERAKIELSSREKTVISLSETEARVRDQSDNDIYLDISLKRDDLDSLIEEKIVDSINSARETLEKAGLNAHDVERIVFIGGPTHYKPLRDKVAFELGIPGSSDINPMTAVAAGAALFAESIDWKSRNRGRKSTRGQLESSRKLAISFNYIARTPDASAKIVAELSGKTMNGVEFQIDSLDTGWTSGRMALTNGAKIDVSLPNTGKNTFKVFVFDPAGGAISLEQDKITITRTAATIDAIPASYSVGIEVLEKIGGPSVLDWLVRANDPLPKKGTKTFKALESLKAGATGSINFKLWEGEIEDPISDNRFIGELKISGNDFDDGVIPAGAELQCDYEVLDSGNIVLEVSVPSIGGTFHSGRNFYSRQEGQFDFSKQAAQIIEEGQRTMDKVEEINQIIDHSKLTQAMQNLESAVSLDPSESETENAQEAMEKVLEAKKLLAQVRKENQKEIRQLELDYVIEVFDDYVRQYARPSEKKSFDSLAITAKRAIENNENDFDNHLDRLKGTNFEIMWRQDWFVVDRFKSMTSSPHLFSDNGQYEKLIKMGHQLLRSDDIEKLRKIVENLYSIQIRSGSEREMYDVANIIRG
jgi:molecular chaperone DnaK